MKVLKELGLLGILTTLLKNLKDMIEMNEKKDIAFVCLNVIDFWIVDLALIVIKNTCEEKYIN